jgi:DNA-binding CsgD family transcriptional regulator
VGSIRPSTTPHTRLGDKRVANLAKRYKNGESVRDLALAYGAHPSTIATHLKRLGIPQRPHLAKPTSHQIETAALKHENGVSYVALATELGVSTTTVRTHVSRLRS